MFRSRFLLSLYFVTGIKDERRHDGFILYQISVSGQNSKDEFCALIFVVDTQYVRRLKPILPRIKLCLSMNLIIPVKID
jgi:hypothetical protein